MSEQNGIDHDVDSTQPGSPGIVSVNSRGAGSNDLAKKLLFVTVVLTVLLVGSLYTFNRYRAAEKARQAQSANDGKAETKAAQGVRRRDFVAENPSDAVAQAAADTAIRPVADKGNGAKGCTEITVLNSAGKPVIGNDGLPVRIACDGKVVPALDRRAMPGALPATGAGAAQPGQQQPKPPSRFGGDVLLEGAAGALRSGQPLVATGTQAQLQAAQTMAANLQRTQTNQTAQSTSLFGSSGIIPTASAAQPVSMGVGAASANGGPSGNSGNAQGAIGSLLTPTLTPKVTAAKIGDRNMLLALGSQIDCALTTKVVNEVSGFASCIVVNNVFSDNGKVLLLERGSEAQGEYVATVQQGQRNLFVLWNRLRTPNGVVITLASPGAGPLGTMGLSGQVDNRWMERIGGAILLSLVKDVIALQIAKSSNGANTSSGAAAYSNSTRAGEQLSERILSSTINIKPTIYINQGDRASIYVARDLDFSTVYALRSE